MYGKLGSALSKNLSEMGEEEGNGGSYREFVPIVVPVQQVVRSQMPPGHVMNETAVNVLQGRENTVAGSH